MSLSLDYNRNLFTDDRFPIWNNLLVIGVYILGYLVHKFGDLIFQIQTWGIGNQVMLHHPIIITDFI